VGKDLDIRSIDTSTYAKWPTRLFAALSDGLFLKTINRIVGVHILGMRGNDGSEYPMCDSRGLLQTNVPLREQFLETSMDTSLGTSESYTFADSFLLYYAYMNDGNGAGNVQIQVRDNLARVIYQLVPAHAAQIGTFPNSADGEGLRHAPVIIPAGYRLYFHTTDGAGNITAAWGGFTLPTP